MAREERNLSCVYVLQNPQGFLENLSTTKMVFFDSWLSQNKTNKQAKKFQPNFSTTCQIIILLKKCTNVFSQINYSYCCCLITLTPFSLLILIFFLCFLTQSTKSPQHVSVQFSFQMTLRIQTYPAKYL